VYRKLVSVTLKPWEPEKCRYKNDLGADCYKIAAFWQQSNWRRKLAKQRRGWLIRRRIDYFLNHKWQTLYLTYPLAEFRFASRVLRRCCDALQNRHEKAKFSFSFLLFDLLFSLFLFFLYLLVWLLIPYLRGFVSVVFYFSFLLLLDFVLIML